MSLLEAFDASPLGAFLSSPLDARGLPSNNLLWSGFSFRVLFEMDGFSSTILQGVQVNAFGKARDLSWDGTNTTHVNFSLRIVRLLEGRFSTTVLASKDISGDLSLTTGVSWSGVNTLVAGSSRSFFAYTGQFGAQTATLSGLPREPNGISWDGQDTLWVESATSGTMFVYEGQFTSTAKATVALGGVDTGWRGISWDGQHTLLTADGGRIYQMDGFTTTVLDSFATPAFVPIPGGPEHGSFSRRGSAPAGA